MKKINKNFFYLICCLLIFIVTFATISKIFENDLFFDIKTGESILKYGIDFRDHFSFISGLNYIYHHWLYNLIIFNIYSKFNYFGIMMFFVLLFFVFGMLVFYINKKHTNRPILSLIVALITICISSFGFTSRVQSITYILFFLEVYFLEQLYVKGEKKYSVFLIIISILIANLHMPLWIFTIILCLPFLCEYIGVLISKKIKIKSLELNVPNNIKIFILTLIMLLFTGLLTPLKLYPYTFFIKSLFNSDYSFILEMKPTTLLYFKYEIILIVIYLLGMYFKILKLKFRDFLIFVGLFLFSIIANRNAIYFLIFMPTIFIKNFNFHINFSSNRFLLKTKKIISKINVNVIMMFCSFVLLIPIYVLIQTMDFKNFDYGLFTYPVESVKYIKQNLEYKKIKMYNDFNYGSYLLFNDIPVFIDSRAEVYVSRFNGGKDIVGDYLDSTKLSKYKEIFNKYDFDCALVYKNSDLEYALIKDSDYDFAFKENDYSLFCKQEIIADLDQKN